MAGETGRKLTRFPARGARAGALLCASLGAAALLSSCDVIKSWFVDEFADYRSSDTNFIAAEGLDKQDLSTAGYQTNASWTWAWRNMSHADDTTGFTYMTMVANGTAGSGYSGLASTSPVYRLTLRNLVANGDIEAGMTGWSADGTATCSLDSASANRVHSVGSSLYIETNDSNGVHFALNSNLLDYDTTNEHKYSWLFFSKATSDLYCQIVTSTSLSTFTATPIANTEVEEHLVPFSSLIGGGISQYILIGKLNTINITYIDDLRIFRTDIADNGCIRLRLRPTDTTPTLARGYYEFTVWIHKPSGYYFPTEDAAVVSADYNYAARKITLSMSNPANKSDGGCMTDPAITVPATGWGKITLRQNAGGNFAALDPESSDPQIELQIYPFDTANPEPGAVEIAQPELHFYLNGY